MRIVTLIEATYSKKYAKKAKTYNSEDSLVVTHPTTNSPACGLSTAERTGSPVFHTLWSYVLGSEWKSIMECTTYDDRKDECAIDRVRTSEKWVSAAVRDTTRYSWSRGYSAFSSTSCSIKDL
ncbi:hypothetical protein ACN42_g11297 [Penicillium freii]|uniref:Uncharacterized protein n=1 Tax=Penicillium freii TaxID=48697 RepID=A0A124GPT0_PENFR|nr:hypothetical protein ACN42_g11297 [Penicillium freii]